MFVYSKKKYICRCKKRGGVNERVGGIRNKKIGMGDIIKDFKSEKVNELEGIVAGIREDELERIIRGYFMRIRRCMSTDRRECKIMYIGNFEYVNSMGVRNLLKNELKDGKISDEKYGEVIKLVEYEEGKRRKKRERRRKKAQEWFGEEFDDYKFEKNVIERYKRKD